VKKVCLVCFLSSQTFFRPMMKNERNEKANEKKAFEDRSNNNLSQKKPIISLLAVPKNAQEEALGSDIASETLLDSERRGGASS
jgi:hypothetical protein